MLKKATKKALEEQLDNYKKALEEQLDRYKKVLQEGVDLKASILREVDKETGMLENPDELAEEFDKLIAKFPRQGN